MHDSYIYYDDIHDLFESCHEQLCGIFYCVSLSLSSINIFIGNKENGYKSMVTGHPIQLYRSLVSSVHSHPDIQTAFMMDMCVCGHIQTFQPNST